MRLLSLPCIMRERERERERERDKKRKGKHRRGKTGCHNREEEISRQNK